MGKFKIEISIPMKLYMFLMILLLVSIGIYGISTPAQAHFLESFIGSLILIGFAWVFVRIFFLKIVVFDNLIYFEVLSYKFYKIQLNDVLAVRFKNKDDFVHRGNPVYSKNAIAIEYLNRKKEKDMFFVSLSKENITSFIKLLKDKGCRFEI